MNGETIKSFLIGLGFEIDDKSLAKFNKAITSASAKITTLATVVTAAAAGIFKGITGISEGFEQMGYEMRLIAPNINKVLFLRQELLKAYGAAGVNLQKVIVQSVKFNMSLAKTGFALKALYTSVGAKFIPMLTKQMDIFRTKIYANMPKIQASLEKFTGFIFKAFDIVVQFGTRVWEILSRVYDFFVSLDKATGGWSTAILGIVAAFKLLNLQFLLTPLGLLISSLAALVVLWDDFKTFKEGGQSLIDWSKTSNQVLGVLLATILSIVPAMFAVVEAIKGVKAVKGIIDDIKGAYQLLRGAVTAVNLAMALNPTTLVIAGIVALIAVIGLLIWKWKLVKDYAAQFFDYIGDKLSKFTGSLKEGFANFFGGAGAAVTQNLQNPLGATGAGPLGTNVANSNQTNQHVNQQTQITVMGSPDASAVGHAVAGQQNRVNMDMTRNLKTAAK